MKKLILIGRSGVGKTTLTQALKGEKTHYQKTQYIDYGSFLIDTPGEYAENHDLGAALCLYAYEADIVALLIAADEQYSHVSLWSLLSAPLLIGCDLATLDRFTHNLLCNNEIIAVNQDARDDEHDQGLDAIHGHHVEQTAEQLLDEQREIHSVRPFLVSDWEAGEESR